MLPEVVYFVLQELHCLLQHLLLLLCNTSTCIPSFILIGCCVSEINGHLCLYHNVWPVYVCAYQVSS